MGDRDPRLRHVLVEIVLHLGEILDARAHIEGLAAAIALAQQRLAHDQRIERRHRGAHGEPVDRRRRDDRELAHPGERKLQGARYRRRGQRQHVDLGAQRLEPFLVADAEMLLLVHHQQAEIPELDGLAEQRMGADDDVDGAVGKPLADLGELGAADQTRRLRHLHREAAEALGEGLEMLARQQRGRHHHRHLLARQRHDEGGAQRHLGLAEADIAADQPVHRTAGGEIVEHGVDRGALIVGLVIGKAGAELVVEPVADGEPRRFAQMALRRDLDEVGRHLEDARLHARLARLPGAAAEPVEIDRGLLGAVARQQLDVLDRQEQLVVAGVVDFQAVMRRAGGLDGLEADEAADAVVDMDDEIAGGEARDLGDEILRALGRLARPHQAIAQDVLLADHREAVGLEAGFEPEHREPDLRLRQRQHGGPVVDRREIEDLVVGEHMAHAVARAVAPQREHDALAGRLQRVHMGLHRLEHVGVGLGPLRREIAALPGAGVDHRRRAFRRRERREAHEPAGVEPLAPFGLGEIEPVRRQRLVGRAAARVGARRHVLGARLVVIGDLGEALLGGVLGQRLDHDRGAGEIIEQRVEVVMEQRQPMLHAGIAAAFAHRLVEQVVGLGRTEGLHIAGAERAGWSRW